MNEDRSSSSSDICYFHHCARVSETGEAKPKAAREDTLVMILKHKKFGVAQHLFAAITRFVELYSYLVFKSRSIYITGKSYAGKYIPAIGYYILKRNAELSKSVNLAGVAIGDGLTDPVIQVATYAVNACFSGLINERQKSESEDLQFEAVNLTKTGNWSEATNGRNQVLRRLQNMNGFATLYDYTKNVPCKTSLEIGWRDCWLWKWGSLSHVVVSGAGHLAFAC
ncbi:hypothetical protein M0R45_032008 [Rubus argutus]|uniref:Carboxypeptidase n=1 Tax=Rubus argutus TaxID=59490 RepID=A0AAW1WI90_RUBAR